ncbi:hypothetical protein B9Z55_027267 [Caenorhabditis nigoni]|nr:hypothetical protein B9Z55_027267 [Caenorhabditis nigoni]
MPVCFPRLPIIVQQEILTNMNPFELFALSECSKRCTKLVPLAGTKEYQFSIDLSYLQISIQTVNFQEYTLSFNCFVPGAFHISAQNPILELKTYLLKFFDIFRSKHIRRFNTGTDDFDNFKSIAKILIERECSIWQLNYQLHYVHRTKELRNILSKLKVTSGLSVAKSADLGSRFEYKRLKFLQEIHINNAVWFRIDQLYSAVNSLVKIELRDSLLSVEDMSVFLEKWMAGEFPNMTAFFISIHSHRFKSNDARALGMQLPIKSEQFTVHRRFLGRFYGCVIGGIVFKNVDGVSAVLYFNSLCQSFDFMVLAQ